jgi:NADH-quinone oxidoreductase subunit C
MSQAVISALKETFPDDVLEAESHCGDERVVVKRDKLVEIATFLKTDPAMRFDYPVFATCIDHFDTDPDGDRFEVCYELRSLEHRHRVRLAVRVSESDARVPTLSAIWPGFNWLERETFDMYGIVYDGHPDLRRIYMYDEFEGYPLRKDYPKEKRQPLVRRDWSDEPMSAEKARATRNMKEAG